MHLLHALAAILGWTPFETAGGTPLHWLPDVDAPVIVGPSPDDGPSDHGVVASVLEALDAWLGIDCGADRIDRRPSFTRPIDAAPAVLSEADHNVSLVWVTSPAEWSQRGFGATELARTAVIHKAQSGEIVDADIALNAAFSFSTTEACTPEVYDLPATIMHEFGHVMGLDHSSVATATMAAKTDAGVCDKRALDPDDEAGFCASYTEPRPPEPEPGPEPEPRPEVVEAVAEPAPRRNDDDCAGADPTNALSTTLVVLLALTTRRERRASAADRR